MSFELLQKKLGFGFMRLPMIGDQVDIAQTNQMVDDYLAAGFNYFDTAHGYIDGKSELAIRECLTSRKLLLLPGRNPSPAGNPAGSLRCRVF